MPSTRISHGCGWNKRITFLAVTIDHTTLVTRSIRRTFRGGLKNYMQDGLAKIISRWLNGLFPPNFYESDPDRESGRQIRAGHGLRRGCCPLWRIGYLSRGVLGTELYSHSAKYH